MTHRIAPGLLRLTAPNPSPLTGAGTNTYILGQDALAIIDPGPDLGAHLAAILAEAAGRPVRQIIVTHSHRDHSALAPRLAAATGAEVLAFGTAQDGISPAMAALAATLPSAGEGLDQTFAPDRRLADGEVLPTPEGPLTVLHTPGHLGNHICLAWGDILFTGDHVMAWATSIVAPPQGDMAAYRAALRRLQGDVWQRFLPGHGDPVTAPAARLAELLAHRQRREDQILSALAQGPATPATLRAQIYIDLAPALWLAAEQNVLAHLIELSQRGLAASTGSPGPKARFHKL